MPKTALTETAEHIAAFAGEGTGGNPAGVVILETMPDAAQMQAVAKQVGYSETVFAMPQTGGWRVRYFAPEGEVAFCGHATIALGYSLARRFGHQSFPLELNDANISVETGADEGRVIVTLVSPPSSSRPVDDRVLQMALDLFGISVDDLSTDIAPAIANAGNDHLVLPLANRTQLAAMAYDFDAGEAFMRHQGFTTLNLVYAETPRLFHSRNAFAIGGVVEDPATGAAAAALGGYLRDMDWPHNGSIDIIQGEDMGARSLLRVDIDPKEPEARLRVTGSARDMAQGGM